MKNVTLECKCMESTESKFKASLIFHNTNLTLSKVFHFSNF